MFNINRFIRLLSAIFPLINQRSRGPNAVNFTVYNSTIFKPATDQIIPAFTRFSNVPGPRNNQPLFSPRHRHIQQAHPLLFQKFLAPRLRPPLHVRRFVCA